MTPAQGRMAATWPALAICAARAQLGDSYAQLRRFEGTVQERWCGPAPRQMGRKDRHDASQNTNQFESLVPLPPHHGCRIHYQRFPRGTWKGPILLPACYHFGPSRCHLSTDSYKMGIVFPAALVSTKPGFSKHLFHHVHVRAVREVSSHVLVILTMAGVCPTALISLCYERKTKQKENKSSAGVWHKPWCLTCLPGRHSSCGLLLLNALVLSCH